MNVVSGFKGLTRSCHSSPQIISVLFQMCPGSDFFSRQDLTSVSGNSGYWVLKFTHHNIKVILWSKISQISIFLIWLFRHQQWNELIFNPRQRSFETNSICAWLFVPINWQWGNRILKWMRVLNFPPGLEIWEHVASKSWGLWESTPFPAPDQTCVPKATTVIKSLM